MIAQHKTRYTTGSDFTTNSLSLYIVDCGCARRVVRRQSERTGQDGPGRGIKSTVYSGFHLKKSAIRSILIWLSESINPTGSTQTPEWPYRRNSRPAHSTRAGSRNPAAHAILRPSVTRVPIADHLSLLVNLANITGTRGPGIVPDVSVGTR